MADIFISYASDDLQRIEPIRKALEDQGWSVWWDRTIPPGKSFDQVIPIRQYQKWFPETPKLYELEMTVLDKQKRILDKVGIRFAMKKIEAKDGKFYLNNKPVFMKCFGDDQLYPYTFAPPADVNYHLENLKTARRYGTASPKSDGCPSDARHSAPLRP